MHAVVGLSVRIAQSAASPFVYAFHSQFYQDADPQSRKGKKDAFVEVVTDVVVSGVVVTDVIVTELIVTDVGLEFCV